MLWTFFLSPAVLRRDVWITQLPDDGVRATEQEMEAIHWHSVFFLLFALVACGFAVAVVLTGNIVRMAFYLVMSLGAVAGLFFLAGADFLGAMQLMVYVGGTLVLLVFGVMLTARGPFISMHTGGGQWIMAAALGRRLLAVLLQTVLERDAWSGRQPSEQPRPIAAVPPTADPAGPGPDGRPRRSLERLAGQPLAAVGLPAGV